MSGKIYKVAYQELTRNEISLLTLLMAYAENTGLIPIAKFVILRDTGLTDDEYEEAVNGLLKSKYLKDCCSANKLEKVRWSSELDTFYFTTYRFFVTWKHGRLPYYKLKPLRKKVFERDDYTCQYCGDRGGELECDHIHPVSKGGSNDIDNLATACKLCNRSKRTKSVEEFING